MKHYEAEGLVYKLTDKQDKEFEKLFPYDDLFRIIMNTTEAINQETQNLIIEELTEQFDYWGENSLFEMIDFCNRNNLKSRQKTLTLLLNLKVWH